LGVIPLFSVGATLVYFELVPLLHLALGVGVLDFSLSIKTFNSLSLDVGGLYYHACELRLVVLDGDREGTRDGFGRNADASWESCEDRCREM
jgi:hypothetical protein